MKKEDFGKTNGNDLIFLDNKKIRMTSMMISNFKLRQCIMA